MKGDIPVAATTTTAVAPTAAATAAEVAPQPPSIVWPTHMRLMQVLVVVHVARPREAGRRCPTVKGRRGRREGTQPASPPHP